MFAALWAGLLWEEQDGRTLLHAMPVMLTVLCILALAYRYYSAFLAAKVAALDDANVTPAHKYNDGQNYHPTNKWVLFGHHFAAISGAGPLIGPVLAIQYGYAPGLLWLVIGVVLAGAVQDMLVLAASVRRDGKSLAEIARTELGPWANVVVSAAILFIVVIALAGLGFVVVKALGGEEVKLPAGMEIRIPPDKFMVMDEQLTQPDALIWVWSVPPGCQVRYGPAAPWQTRSEGFKIRWTGFALVGRTNDRIVPITAEAKTVQLVPGSSWGTFTIACTIPIALFVSLWMYKIRKGHIMEASAIGAVGVLAATVAGNWIPGSALEPYFSLNRDSTILALCGYGFVASVLPVWLLLCPRDYISSFLKIGTIALLVVGVLVANPVLAHPPINETFAHGGPTFAGSIFPFVFICIMCGAVSGFHALVSSGTTPKMVDRETQVRTIGYGAMLMEGLVGVVALLAAASLDPKLYYDINVDLDRAAQFEQPLQDFYQSIGREARDPLHLAQVDAVQHLDLDRPDLAQVEELVGGESLRGRTGGAVTLAVGMSLILTKPLHQLGLPIEGLIKYWYHFAIMFEALFILTTIDTGTRIARFLLQEALGQVHPQFGKTDWWPGAVAATAVVTMGWGFLVWGGSINTIWPMFGIANQLLAVIALCLVATLLINSGRARYAWVTVLPMAFVCLTTLTAGFQLITTQFPARIAQGEKLMAQGQTAGQQLILSGWMSIILALFVIACVLTLLLIAAARWLTVLSGNGRPPQQAAGPAASTP